MWSRVIKGCFASQLPLRFCVVACSTIVHIAKTGLLDANSPVGVAGELSATELVQKSAQELVGGRSHHNASYLITTRVLLPMWPRSSVHLDAGWITRRHSQVRTDDLPSDVLRFQM
jgi:hypothetical protein